MLQTLREKSTGWIATIILGLLMVPFAFFGMEQYLFQRNATYAAQLEAPPTWWPSAPSWWPVSMLWDQEEISADEFRTVFEQQRQQQRQALGDSFDPRSFESAESKREILDGLIDRRVMRMAADREGLVIGDAHLRDTIQSVPAFQVAGRFDPQTYQLALSSQNQSPRQFEQIVREDLQQTILPRGIAESAFVTKSELDRLLRLVGETRRVSYAILPMSAASAAPVPEADVQRWYQQHANEYRAPETVTLDVLDIDAGKLAPPPAPGDEELRERYAQQQAASGGGEQRLVSHILIKDEAKAKTVAAQAKAPGADFAALARANSEDAGSKNAGGDLGRMQKNGGMPKPFEEAVFAMRAGEVRGPVTTDFGYHVIQLREIQAGTQKPFEELRGQLLADAAKADREKRFNDLLGKLVDEVYKNPTTLAPAARLAGQPVQTIAGVSRVPSPATAANPIASNPAVLRAAFTESLIQDGTVSDPIELAPDRSVLLRVKAHTPERQLPLAQVRERIAAAIRADRAEKAATDTADAVLAQLRSGQALAAVAAARKAPVADIPELQRGQPVPDPATNEAMFSAPPPVAGKPSYGKVIGPGGQAVVFAVIKVTPGDPAKATTEQRQALREQLAQLGGVDDAQALVRALRQQMKITVAEDRL